MNHRFSYKDEEIYFHHSIDEKPKDTSFKMHLHEQLEIYCYIGGDAVYLVEGTEYPLIPGCILIMRPSESHMIKILSDKTYERFSLHFLPDIISGIDPSHTLLKPFYDHPLGKGNLFLPTDFKLEQPLELLQNMCNTGISDMQKKIEIKIRLFTLLSTISSAFLSKQFELKNTDEEKLTQKILNYVNLHLFDDLTLGSLSEYFFMSVSQFSRVFKNATGSSVWEYIMIKRLIAAKNNIKKGTQATVAAQQCGFHDYSAFYRAYKKFFGHSPNKDL